jgi:hypothetical protein
MGNGELLLRFLELTGWRVDVSRVGSEFRGFAHRPGDPTPRITAAAESRDDLAVELFELACERMYGRRPTVGAPPDAGDVALLH